MNRCCGHGHIWRVHYPIDDCLVQPRDFFCGIGIDVAKERHDALARRKYVKPFKWFKFNRASRKRP